MGSGSGARLGDLAPSRKGSLEKIPQQEWLIYGFPVDEANISEAEAGRFIEVIVKSLMQGSFVYVTGHETEPVGRI